MTPEQLPLFPPPGSKRRADEGGWEPKPLVEPTSIGPDASLSAAIGAYYDHMRAQGLSPYTIQAFNGDLNLFRNHVGSNVRVADISIDTISRFMNWLRYERGVPCKPKSYQRRLTTLKVFFAWLMQTGVIPEDPAASIAHQPVTSPLPAILYPDQVEKLLDASRAMRDADRGDIRPYLLVSLLLATGIKKSEAMAIRLADIDLSGREGVLYIRYEDARKRHKERKLRLPRDFAESYTRYQRQYHPSQKLFECTARNLEYVLADLAKMTGLGETVSFESLRWTCAVRDYTAGMKDDTLRQKLGLSAITWEEAGDRLRRLAAKPL